MKKKVFLLALMSAVFMSLMLQAGFNVFVTANPITEVFYGDGCELFEQGIYVIATTTNPVEMLGDYPIVNEYYEMLKENVTTDVGTMDFVSILISRGVFPTTGYGIRIGSINWTDNAFALDADFTDPGWNVVVGAMITTPIALIPIGNLSTGSYSITLHIDEYVYFEYEGEWVYQLIGHETWTSTFKVVIKVPGDYPTIQAAVNNASDGDTILVSSGIYHEHVVVNKTVSLVGENKNTTIVDGNGTVGNGFHITASNVNITGFTIQNNGSGEPKDTGNGIYVYGAITNVSVSDNIIANNTYGVNLRDYPYGNILIGNTIIMNTAYGIELDGASENIIRENIIANSTYGINIEGSSNNQIVENTVINNSYVGINVHSNSISNEIFHNNFIDNINQALLESSTSSATWDNGCEGNYWTNYNGSDLDSDGVGDEYLPWEGVDYHPLANPYWNPTDINHDLKVDIKDIAAAAKVYGLYPSHPLWNPHADITGPIPLKPDDKVDIKDIALIAINYGKTWTP